MLSLGRQLARTIRPGLVIHLVGDLGAGKTTLARGVLAGLGHVGKVKSPTYTLVEPYTVSRLECYHFDLYRFKDELEWHDAGFSELFDGQAIALIEWPEKAAHLVPPADLRVSLRSAAAGGRDVLIEGLTEAGRTCLADLIERSSHGSDDDRSSAPSSASP